MQTAAVIGGGFFGCMIAMRLRQQSPRVILVEKETDLLQRASYKNQARVHNGYHYPRSMLTAMRSRANFARFIADFRDCVESDFTHYYAVGRELSKVTALYFREFCRRIEAPLQPAPDSVRRMFSPDLIEDVFVVTEYAFDAVRLKEISRRMLEEAGVELWLGTEVERVQAAPSGRLELQCSGGSGQTSVVADQVYNCTYSGINQVLSRSGLPQIPLKHELAEMALVEPPVEFLDKAVTVMCGPFFSCMPFPARGLHSLSHVRYTPHMTWQEGGQTDRAPLEQHLRGAQATNFPHMSRDVRRYLPLLGECRYVDSLWEVKTVLPVSEHDDSRPILFKKHWGLQNLHCVMGAKIDNIYDGLDEIDQFAEQRRCA